MANDTDQLLVSELMEIVQPRNDERPAARQSRVRPARRGRFFDIVFWSGVTNLTLLACFLAGWNFETLRARFISTPVAQALSARNIDPLASSRRELQDNELLTSGPQRQLKGPLQFTLVPSTPETPPEASADAYAPSDSGETASLDASPGEQDQGDGSGEITVGPEDPAAQLAKGPILRKSQKNGDVEIGSFTTVSLPGPASECLDTAYGLLEDAGAARDKLKVLAETSIITVARICAANGSLIVTCRSNQITISPRRLKPNETCTG